MIDIRLRQQEAKLRSMREDIQNTMSEIDSCLSQLDHIDERAKVRTRRLPTEKNMYQKLSSRSCIYKKVNMEINATKKFKTYYFIENDDDDDHSDR